MSNINNLSSLPKVTMFLMTPGPMPDSLSLAFLSVFLILSLFANLTNNCLFLDLWKYVLLPSSWYFMWSLMALIVSAYDLDPLTSEAGGLVALGSRFVARLSSSWGGYMSLMGFPFRSPLGFDVSVGGPLIGRGGSRSVVVKRVGYTIPV